MPYHGCCNNKPGSHIQALMREVDAAGRLLNAHRRGSVTEESRLQSILAISVVSTKNASLQSQSHFDYDGATIR
jgi:hypothetical protein